MRQSIELFKKSIIFSLKVNKKALKFPVLCPDLSGLWEF
jgi:hypothetical protein